MQPPPAPHDPYYKPPKNQRPGRHIQSDRKPPPHDGLGGLNDGVKGTQIHQSNPALPNIPKSQLERLNEYYGRGGGPEMENVPPLNERLKRINYNSNEQPFDYVQ